MHTLAVLGTGNRRYQQEIKQNRMNVERTINEFLAENNVKPIGVEITIEGQRNGFKVAKSALQLLFAERKDTGLPPVITKDEVIRLMDNLIKW